MPKRRHIERILAIDPMHGGFGFAVVEDRVLIDCGLVICKEGRVPAHIEKLFLIYEPSLTVAEDTTAARRSQRFFNTVHHLAKCSDRFGSGHRHIDKKQVRACFPGFNKHERAKHLSICHPEIAARLPKARKPWHSEPRAYSIFDALTLIKSLHLEPCVLTTVKCEHLGKNVCAKRKAVGDTAALLDGGRSSRMPKPESP